MLTKFRDVPQILALLSGSLTAFSSGALFAFSSPAIPKLMADYKFTIEEISYLPVLPPIAMLLTAPVFSRLIDKIGRKYTLLIAGVFHIISWIITALAQNIYVFYLARIMYGISDASFFTTLPIYIAEVTTPKVRSFYGNSLSVAAFLGQLSANCVGFYFSIQIAAFIMLTVPIFFITTFIFMPETPYYFIMIGNTAAAKRSLTKLRSSDNVCDELEQINTDVLRQMSEKARFKDLWLIESNRKALMIAIACRLFHQLSGYGSLVVYCQYIFQEAGGDMSSGVAAIIVSVIFAITVIFATFITDKLGRRKSMIISCFGCAVALLGEAIYFYLQIFKVVNLSIINWFPVVGIVIFAISFCTGLGVVPVLLAGEIFSANIRKHAGAVVNVVYGVCLCIFTKLFQMMMTKYGVWVPFLLFSLCSFVDAIISYFIVPETKGKTLEEIQQMLKSNKN